MKVSARPIISFVFLVTITGCANKPHARTGRVPDQVAYDEGVVAFREGTPEGYQRAVEAFTRAATLQPANCEYSLQLAQALTFLAHEQKYNWEEFEPRLSKAITILDSLACSPPFTDRVRAHATYLHDPTKTRDYVALINRSLESDPNDALSWVVLAKLQPNDRRNPAQH